MNNLNNLVDIEKIVQTHRQSKTQKLRKILSPVKSLFENEVIRRSQIQRKEMKSKTLNQDKKKVRKLPILNITSLTPRVDMKNYYHSKKGYMSPPCKRCLSYRAKKYDSKRYLKSLKDKSLKSQKKQYPKQKNSLLKYLSLCN